ncbi:MAG: tRNA (adenosine(37)-N6)-threonylcarbamoyltransferase complex ATPase subunit type 1 TsaE [Syntrophorhabdaceae bacterium]|nr:tRNA (adenosine(37)-N6)-threonylcarbamoyltransferase complex ATPase subunit type 1 TsaE [Syntrophorhabdaceae bacterium]
MNIELVSNSAEDTLEIARLLGKTLVPGDVIALTGDLGAGKTCFCKGVGEALGISPDRITSPTFTIATEHKGRLDLNHIDVYRLDSAREAVEIGIDETLSETKGVCVVEWAEKVEQLLPSESIRVTFFLAGDDSRKITISGPQQERFAAFRKWCERFSSGG